MNYDILRIILDALLLILMVLWVIRLFIHQIPDMKRHRKKKIRTIILMTIGFYCFTECIPMVPFENLFIGFQTSQAAFSYACPNMSLGTIVSNDKVAVALGSIKKSSLPGIYHIANGNTSTMSFVKGEKGWQMNVPFYPGAGTEFRSVGDLLIYLVQANGQLVVMVEDRSVDIWPTGQREEKERILTNVSDSFGSTFTYELVKSKSFESHLYYTFLELPVDQYSLFLNGEETVIY